MNEQKNIPRITFLVILGNILEYYDFLLFAHLGFIITPLYFPNHSSTQTHILSLALFGLSFVIRPIGGFIFGVIADKQGRKTALVQSVKWAVFPALALACLPGFETIGIWGSYIFVLLRLFQGVALGGEYPTAGTYLMESRKDKYAFFSSLLVASGSIGSLLGLGFAIICMQPESPSWLWRVAFILGGVGSFISYYLRKYLVDSQPKASIIIAKPKNLNSRRLAVFVMNILIGMIVWLPMTYSNFYVTKILGYSNDLGIYASTIGVISFILFLPIMGIICDKMDSKKYIIWASLFICPMSIFFLYLLTKGNIVFAQMGLALAAAIFSAPVHKLANSLFPPSMRGRNVGLLLMLGTSFGGMFPGISSYLVSQTRWDLAPAFLMSVIAVITYFCLRNQDFDNALGE